MASLVAAARRSNALASTALVFSQPLCAGVKDKG